MNILNQLVPGFTGGWSVYSAEGREESWMSKTGKAEESESRLMFDYMRRAGGTSPNAMEGLGCFDDDQRQAK